MVAQIKENILKSLTHPELALTELSAQPIVAQLKDGKFCNIDYNEQEPVWGWFNHIKQLSKLAGNVAVLANNKDNILKALQLFLDTAPTHSNPWYQQVGLPRYLGRLYLLLETDLCDKTKETLLSYIQKGEISANQDLLTNWTGTNLLWVVMNNIMCAVITNDLTQIPTGIEKVTQELVYHHNMEYGIQDDYSFIPYPTQYYINETPYSFTRGCAQLVYALQKTEYQIPVDALWVLGFYFVFGLWYGHRNSGYDYLTLGKELAYPGAINTEKLRQTMWMFLTVDDMVCRDVMAEQFASLSYEMYSLRADKYSYTTNTYVKRQATFHASCVGTGPNTVIDTNNLLDNGLSSNLYAGGATCFMANGEEYKDIFPLWDFTHIPGTTTPEEINNNFKGIENTYCGGFSHNDYGVLYQDINYNGVTGVTARFFVDGVMVALGAGIACDKNIPVTTTINQCWQTEDLLPLSNGVYQGNMLYITLDGQEIKVESCEKEGCWSSIGANQPNKQSGKICTFMIPHGTKPNGASYAYAVVPAVSKGSAEDRLEEVIKQIKIVQNDQNMQAIEYKNKVYCVFHKNGIFHLERYNHFVANGPSVHVFHN